MVDSVRTAEAYDFSHLDNDLRMRIGIALAHRQRVAWRVVRIVAQNGVVNLQGAVPSYYDRQLIVAVAQHVAGVRRVDDELTVEASPVRTEAPSEPAVEAPTAHGGSELKPAPAPNPYQEAIDRLPVLSPSLEEILAARADGRSAMG